MGKKKRRPQPSKGSEVHGINFTIDSGLSRSYSGRSRGSASTIPSPLEEGNTAKSNVLKSPTKDLVEENARLIKECADKDHRLAGLEMVEQEYTKIKDVQSDFESMKEKRESLAVYKRNIGDVIQSLMDEALIKFPEIFLKESRDLIELAIILFSWSDNPLNIDKIWDLIKLGHNLIPNYIPALKFKKLLSETYSLFRGEFRGDQFRIVMQMDFGGYNPCIERNKAKRLRALSNSIRSLVQSEDIREKLVNMIILTLNLFHKCPPQKKFDELLEKSRELFTKEFPLAPFHRNFIGMVAILEGRESSEKDENSLVIIRDMLDALRDVAGQFEWSERTDTQGRSNEDFGFQFFHLCKDVAWSNRVVFHKKLVLEEVEANARKAKYKAGDYDVGSAVVGCFKAC